MKKFDGTEGAAIDLNDAARWTANYRSVISTPETIRAHMFGNNVINAILNQEECVGIRMFYALDDTGMKQLILVGVDSEGKDLENGIVADRSKVCPPECGATGKLSSGSIIRKS